MLNVEWKIPEPNLDQIFIQAFVERSLFATFLPYQEVVLTATWK